LNSQTNSWKKLKIENYMGNYENFFFFIVGYTAAEICLIFKLKKLRENKIFRQNDFNP
jgi:hypothetical protein